MDIFAVSKRGASKLYVGLLGCGTTKPNMRRVMKRIAVGAIGRVKEAPIIVVPYSATRNLISTIHGTRWCLATPFSTLVQGVFATI